MAGRKRALPIVEMPFARPSASNAEAFVKCGASHVLPQSDKHGDYRDKGSEAHEPLAAVINNRVPQTTLRGVMAVKDFNLGEVLEGTHTRRAETAYAVNVKEKTARYLGQDLGRNYGKLEPYEIPCTIDVEAKLSSDGRPWIRDWKFGTYASWWQLLVQGMAIAYGAADDEEPAYEVDAGFVFIDATVHGAWYFEEKKILSLEEIDEAAEALYNAWQRVEQWGQAFQESKTVPPQAVGDWCKYCKAFTSCPSQWKLVGALLNDLTGIEQSIPEYTPEDMGLAWAKVRSVKAQLERIEDAIKGAALREAVPLPSGKYLQMIECQGRVSVDKDIAQQTIRRLGGSDADIDAIWKRGRPFLMPKETRKQ